MRAIFTRIPRILRLAAVAALMALLVTGCAQQFAHPPDAPGDSRFEKATAMEATDPQGAVNALIADSRLNDDNHHPEIAAQALLQAGQFAASQAYGAGNAKRIEGDNLAHNAYKQLLQQYPDSPLAATARSNDIAVEKRIDARNSITLGYRVVDFLVALTGRVPAFSYWFALLLIALFVKAITFPLTRKMYASQREMQSLMPHIKELQAKYKGAELSEKTMEVYKEHGVNPLASCFPMLIQYPFLILVYDAIRLYEFHFTHGTFLWIGSALATRFPGYVAHNLGEFDVPLLLIYSASNFFMMKLTPAADPTAAQSQKQMALITTGV
ncbi:MAG TPA: YidC/Oxa1 family membrane protein insertase, partial [Chthonomonadales bacterium]|nr:YidC/Oxa1 family membrane protein insertase [Chthonomonadales bacterium]